MISMPDIKAGASRDAEHSAACGGVRPEVRRRLPTTIGFAAVPDHVRLPSRFFGRFTASAVAGLS
ncbi:MULTISPECIES: hypothetical protein [Ancylobacter]|uniref:Uncharacterized protein n=2 Tax=Ancylobacter TaxID=99 RepID=A0A839ZBS5_9HYPH|nr:MULTISPECIES: hypothetical protein [Ancylobacter]MBB3772240.1 hypothetical protein [Ancylobacter tetraedralis]MDQ0510486.1 hypothetical protein [Ancylobacter amanitiformis]